MSKNWAGIRRYRYLETTENRIADVFSSMSGEDTVFFQDGTSRIFNRNGQVA